MTFLKTAWGSAKVRAVIAAFLVVLAGYGLTNYGGVRSIDADKRLEVAKSIVRHHDFYIRESDGSTRYCVFDLGQSLAFVPCVLLGDVISWDPMVSGCCTFESALVVAMTVALFCAFGLDLGFGVRTVLATSIILAFASILWPYSQDAYYEPLSAMLCLGSFYCAWQAGRSPSVIHLGIMTCCLGAACLVKLTNVFIFPSLLILLVPWVGKRRCPDLKSLWALLLVIPFGITILAYNQLRYGSYLAFAANAVERAGVLSPHPMKGVLGLTISLQNGLVWFSPITVLSVLGAHLFYSKYRLVSLALWTATLLFAVGNGILSIWWAGWSWGSRLLVPIVPVLSLPILSLIEYAFSGRVSPKSVFWRSLCLRLVVTAVVLIGISVQLSAVTVSWTHLYYSGMYWQEEFSLGNNPIVWQFRRVIEVLSEYPDLDRSQLVYRTAEVGPKPDNDWMLEHEPSLHLPTVWWIYRYEWGLRPGLIAIGVITWCLLGIVGLRLFWITWSNAPPPRTGTQAGSSTGPTAIDAVKAIGRGLN